MLPATFSLPHLLVFSTLLCLVSSSSSLPPILPSSHLSSRRPLISALASLVSSCPAHVTLPLSSVAFLRVLPTVALLVIGSAFCCLVFGNSSCLLVIGAISYLLVIGTASCLMILSAAFCNLHYFFTRWYLTLHSCCLVIGADFCLLVICAVWIIFSGTFKVVSRSSHRTGAVSSRKLVPNYSSTHVSSLI